MSKGIDLSHIYNLRNNFTVIGLTGQIGSGCSEVAEQLVKGFNTIDFETPDKIGFDKENGEFKHNSFRKYRIIHNYASVNFKGYTRIDYKNVLVMFLLNYSFDKFIRFLKSKALSSSLKELFAELKLSGGEPNFNLEVIELNRLKQTFNSLSRKYKKISIIPSVELHNFFFGSEFQSFCSDFHEILKNNSRIKRNKLLQTISMNLRKSGKPDNFSYTSTDKVFTIVELINYIIKSHEKFIIKKIEEGEFKEERTQIVIDDLRNPIEIMFFKQRFSAYYTVAINRDINSRMVALDDYSTPDTKEIREDFWNEEYKGGKDDEFFKANISACIQQADIHISFVSQDEVDEINKKLEQNSDLTKIKKPVKDNTSPYFSWKVQLLKYVSLISHPGLITPSPEERCMQMAYTAKHNSGCISRHVGAAITDENFSIKAVGWNTTPEGLVPCVLRCAQDLINPQETSDKKAFSFYEYDYDFQKDIEYIKNDEYDKNDEFRIDSNPKFRNELIKYFDKQIKKNNEKLKGRNVCFCFKDVRNSFSKDGKNQVHTRSLHAEENAFLQLAKYGGMGIENGKLFTTASPCELCAKKAYQLGIKVIYYIDPYPGISEEQILSAGTNQIKPRLFNGAIGNAYHWLYDPIMPYKDELSLLLDSKIPNYVEKLEKKIEDLKKNQRKRRIR